MIFVSFSAWGYSFLALGFDFVAGASIFDGAGMEPRVGGKFRLGRKIGSGSFGEIYLGLFALFFLFFFVNFLSSFFFFENLINGCSMWVNYFAGTNIQTNEEVAIKLVSFLLSSFC